MDYEQKCKEYLERAKEQLNGAKVFDYDNEQIAHDIRTTVYNIFPELKEREDEMVRKQLLEMVHDTTGDSLWVNYNIHKDDAIALLEKQGNTKETLCDKCKKEQPFHSCQDITALGRCTVEHTQNPAWSEDDESIRRHLMLILMELGLSGVKYSTVPKYHFDREIEWLCNLHPQPKEEWSKKDEAIKLAWLKSLFPQNRCTYNPYKAVVESIAEMCKHYDKASHSGLRDFYDNVKIKCKDAKEYDSLFPQNTWKPSEADILLLERVANGKSNPQDFQASLYALIGQLKKLREE